jgi:NAD(P) transhydrogenase subunit alpha
MPVTVVAIRERAPNERRVALSPEVAKKLKGLGASVLIESGAGGGANLPDSAYPGAEATAQARDALARADVLLKVQPPTLEEIAALREGSVLISYLQPHADPERTRALRDRKITSFAMELLPRTTRAQAMDVLSSQAGMAGYKAVLIAAQVSGKFFPMLTTAAGTIRPSKVLIVGAGVAGLQAIATARRLGAQVEGFDVRPETANRSNRSAPSSLISASAPPAAAAMRASSPPRSAPNSKAPGRASQECRCDRHHGGGAGRRAPRIITAAMVEGMKPGSVIVDLAAETGGNCELTRPGETYVHNASPSSGPSICPAWARSMPARCTRATSTTSSRCRSRMAR